MFFINGQVFRREVAQIVGTAQRIDRASLHNPADSFRSSSFKDVESAGYVDLKNLVPGCQLRPTNGGQVNHCLATSYLLAHISVVQDVACHELDPWCLRARFKTNHPHITTLANQPLGCGFANMTCSPCDQD